MDMINLLQEAVKNRASDLHLSAGIAPMLRVDGDLRRLGAVILDHQGVLKLIFSIMDGRQRNEYEANLEIDFSFELVHLARFRVNVFMQARGAAAVFRVIPFNVCSMSALNLPPIFTEIASLPHGLVLITGPAGSGKSTTLAAMIDFINTTRANHIITIEDPIEFVHISHQCLVNQREVHRDTKHFTTALRSALREDPDVILIGELRDLETIRLALTAAETGHLVLASLHTASATGAIHRIIDVFPGDEKSLVRSLLSEALQAVVAQRLLKKVGGGRVVALEVMRCNAAIRHLIREDKVAQMYSSIQTGQAQGMRTLDQHLMQLLGENLITRETACNAAVNKSVFSV